MNEFIEAKVALSWAEMKKTYDVVIIGGGGHGLATAYYLATRHGITNVAVLERKYIGGGNSGRNTTVIRANYGIPEAIRFYKHSVDMYGDLEQETDRWIMHDQKGILWAVHTHAGVRQEKSRSIINQEFGYHTEFVEPREIKKLVPQIDLNAGEGRFPILGASYSPDASTARHDRVNWALAEGAMRAGVDVLQRVEVVGLINAVMQSWVLKPIVGPSPLPWSCRQWAAMSPASPPWPAFDFRSGPIHCRHSSPITTHKDSKRSWRRWTSASTSAKPPEERCLPGLTSIRSRVTRTGLERTSSPLLPTRWSPSCHSCVICECSASGPASATCRPTTRPSWGKRTWMAS